MKKILPILALTLLSISFKAHALGGNSSAKEWTRASSTEQYEYAKKVLKGPFPKGEATIAKNPEYSYAYARDVLKGPF